MGRRTTDEEARTIIRLYESGKNLKEITEETGRSRESINRVLRTYGLDWGGYDDGDVFRYAERDYNKWLQEKYGYSEAMKYKRFRNLSPKEKEIFLIPAKEKMIEQRRINYRLLFTGIEEKKDKDPNSVTIKLTPVELEALNYLSQKYALVPETLIGFLILKEKIELELEAKSNE